MALGYTYQNNFVLIGSRDGSTITTEELESTYHADAIKSFPTRGHSRVNFNIRYTMGSGETSNTLQIRIETSPDGNVWHQLVNETVSGGTSTLTQREFTITGTDADDHDFSLPLDVSDKFMRISFKESGVSSTKGSVYCEATLGGER